MRPRDFPRHPRGGASGTRMAWHKRVKRTSTLIQALSLSLAVLAAACAPSSPKDAGGEGDGVLHTAIDRPAQRPEVLGINIDPMNDRANPGGDELGELGATRVRIELKVPYREELSEDDELAAAMAAYDRTLSDRIGPGVSVLFILDYMTLDAKRYPDRSEDGFRKAFAARAAAITGHYRERFGVEHYEIWNEEDLCEASGYCPKLDEEVYAPLLSETAAAIHGVDGGIQVAMGGLGAPSWEAYLSKVVERMGDDWGQVDAVGVHPYTHWPKAMNRGEELEYQLGRCASIGQKPLWLTEWGDGGSQAEMIAAYFPFFADEGIEESRTIAEAYLFAWSDAQRDDPDRFGLFDRDGNKKEAEWSAFHAAARPGD
jgi:hypothetical protein